VFVEAAASVSIPQRVIFLGRFLFAIAVEPFDDFLIRSLRFQFGLEIVP